MKRSNPLVSLCAASLIASAGLLVAGPLTPPAGSVASTYKTLGEVEPRTPISAATTPGDADSVFRITAPGSYYLTGNITGAANKGAIEIAASDVTIDLSGFALQGVASSLDGIRSTLAGSNITIRNGSIRGFADNGIDLSTFGAITGAVVESVQVANNLQLGMDLATNVVVRACTAASNGNSGIAIGSGVVESCTSQSNGAQGISAGINGVVRNCVCRLNSNKGISVGYTSVVSGCSSYDNGGMGISGSSHSIVESCTTRANSGSGISVNDGCMVRNCLSSANGPGSLEAGIELLGTHSRIEGNTCIANARGIRAGSGTFSNAITRNTCSGNTVNWEIAAANALGPIVVVTVNPGAVSGNSYAGSLGSTDPNANFTH